MLHEKILILFEIHVKDNAVANIFKVTFRFINILHHEKSRLQETDKEKE